MNRAGEIPEARLGLQSFRSRSPLFSLSFRLFGPFSVANLSSSFAAGYLSCLAAVRIVV